MTTTAAFSPFSNGVVQRHNSVPKTMPSKMREAHEFEAIDDQTLLSQAVYAKNTLSNRHGFSPFQLVFGKHHLSLNGESNYQNCEQRNRLKSFENLIAKSRQQFLAAENSERIRSALSNKQSVCRYESFQPESRHITETEQKQLKVGRDPLKYWESTITW